MYNFYYKIFRRRIMKNILRLLLGVILCLMILPMTSKAEQISLPKIASLSDIDTVTAVDFTSDDVFFATGDDYNNIAVWKTSDGTLVNKWKNTESNATVTKLIYGPDDEVIYTATEDGVVQSWDINSSTSKTFVDNDNNYSIGDLALNEDGSLLYVANSYNNQVMFLDANSGNEKKS